MATATKKLETVQTVKVVYEEKVTGVTLELTEIEARALCTILGNVSGHPNVEIGGGFTLRHYSDSIYRALGTAGIAFDYDVTYVDRSLAVNNKEFK